MQNLVTDLTLKNLRVENENRNLKQRLDDLERKDGETRDEIKNLSKIVDAFLRKLENLTEK